LTADPALSRLGLFRLLAAVAQAVPVMLVVLLPAPAAAWNAAGHRLVACIAWENLDQSTRTEIAALLHTHPDHDRWDRRGGKGDPDRTVFIESSTWPDDIRSDARFYDGTDEPTFRLAGFPDMARHRDWHYINRRLDGQTAPRSHRLSGQLDTQLRRIPQLLGANRNSSELRAYLLPWLNHLVADAHQPLHTSGGRNAEDNRDESGNGTRIINPFNPRKKRSSLHAFWDDLPGPSWLRGKNLDDTCQALIALHPRPRRSFSSEHWITESLRIAQDRAFPPNTGKTAVIEASFFANSRDIANRRIVEAGYRLADVLNHLFGAQGSRR
jgi:hypothetical protein